MGKEQLEKVSLDEEVSVKAMTTSLLRLEGIEASLEAERGISLKRTRNYSEREDGKMPYVAVWKRALLRQSYRCTWNLRFMLRKSLCRIDPVRFQACESFF